jgi:two-component system, chemotaxis family, sensor kinase CheA
MAIDLAQFHDAFFQESFEALDSMESALLQLDTGSPDPELINTIFRAAHSIKGGGATFGFAEIAAFTHSLETALGELRDRRLTVTQAISDLLLKSVDMMRAMLAATQAKQPVDMRAVADLQASIERIIVRRDTGSVEWHIQLRPAPEFFERGADPIRIFRELSGLGALKVTAHLDALPDWRELVAQRCYLSWSLHLLSNAGESAIREILEWLNADFTLSTVAEPAPLPATPHQVQVVPAVAASSVAPAAEAGSIRVGVEKIDELINMVGELVITHAMLSQLSRSVSGPAADGLRSGIQQLERNTRQLQESVMRVRMLPISVVFNRFPRMVRDLAQQLDKQIELQISGETTELDKTVLEKIGDPLVHLVRNCVDHGIEKSGPRLAAGKSAAGTIHLNASHRGGSVVLEVSDDGAGLDPQRIMAKARSAGLTGPHETLSPEQVQELIFVPGFSTAETTTEVSGRGVGMDVVRRNITDLGGKIEVHSERGRGCRFVITLPLTLAIVDGLSVAVGDQTYIVPMTSTIESLRLTPTQVTTIADGREVFGFRNEYLPIVRLYKLFGLTPRVRALHDGLVVIVEGGGRRIGLFVDDLLSQQQVVIKSLETNYGRVPGVAAATILGDGSVALILDIADLIRIVSRREAA